MKHVLVLLVIGTVLSGIAAFAASAGTSPTSVVTAAK